MRIRSQTLVIKTTENRNRGKLHIDNLTRKVKMNNPEVIFKFIWEQAYNVTYRCSTIF